MTDVVVVVDEYASNVVDEVAKGVSFDNGGKIAEILTNAVKFGGEVSTNTCSFNLTASFIDSYID